MAVFRDNLRSSHRGAASQKMLALIAMVTLSFAGAAVGQARPAGPPRPPRDDDFPRDRGMPDRDLPERGDREARRHDVAGGRGDAQSDFPSREVHGAVEANARTAFARANFHRMQDSLNTAI